MTAPATMVKRRLTINFQRSVKAGKPQVMEVVVAPLTDPSAPNSDATLVGGPQSQDVLLGNENNPVYFDLVPTDNPDLTDRLTYRVAWREKFMGRQFTQDFVMPDFDCAFDDLQDLGNVIGGETYLQWPDRLRPGGVAGLNQSGQVIDSTGNPVTGAESAAIVQGNLDSEVVARQQGDQFLRQYFLSYAQDQVSQLYRTTSENLAAAVTNLQNADLIEKTARTNGDNAIRNDMAVLEDNLAIEVNGIEQDLTGIRNTLINKADLVNGKIPSNQIPSVAIGNAVPADDEAEMLELTAAQVQPGDLCVRPDGTWMLNDPDPSDIDNWVKLSSSGSVASVNGQTGAVNLSAADVSARPAGVPIPQADIAGLSASFAQKANVTVTNDLNTRVTAIETNPTLVKTVGGVVPHAQHGNDVAFLNAQSQLVNKQGQVINLTGGGGVLDITDVTGLQAELNSKLDVTSPAVTDARIPLSHADTHKSGGSDPITPLPISDITGLQAIIANNNLTSTSNHGNRINALETAVAGGGGTGGGGGTPVKTTWWDGPSPATDFSTVMLKSPFGKAISDGHLYYDPVGAAEGEAVFPHISPNGHLVLRQRNEGAPADPVLAKQTDLDVTNATVATKADQAALQSTNAAVSLKATQADLNATNATLVQKASITQLSALGDVVATKASQAALDGTNITVATKANQSDLSALQATLGTKADNSALASTNSQVTALQTGKADLAGGLVPLTQIPPVPTSRVTNLDIALGNKADQASLNTTNSNLAAQQALLSNKADLIGGLVPTSQLPALAFNTTVTATSRAQMLGLTPAQVQPGDICVITQGPDQGSYILNAPDPSVFTNWVLLSTPGGGGGGSITLVNGQAGPVVVLAASDVGARSSSTPINQNEVTGLTTALSNKADTSAMNTALAGKPSYAEVDSRISQSTNNKLPVGLVATASIPSLSGQQSIDGVLAPIGTAVLVTAQSSSVNNGLYQVASAAWPRLTDMNTGDYFIKGTQVIVTGGTTNHDSIWQESAASGIVGTNANNWIKSVTAGAPPNYTASLGVKKVVNDFQAQVVAGGGIQAVAGGLQIDPAVGVRKAAVDVPAGSSVVTITHNLGTTDVSASFRDKASGDFVLLGWKPTGPNTISAEFDAAPAAGQWRCVIQG